MNVLTFAIIIIKVVTLGVSRGFLKIGKMRSYEQNSLFITRRCEKVIIVEYLVLN